MAYGRLKRRARPGFNHWVSFKGQGRYRDPEFNVNGEQVKRKGHTTDLVADYAVDFLEDAGDEPFCLYLSHKAVHAHFDPPEHYQGTYADKKFPHPASMANTEENYRGKPEWVRRQRQSWHGVDGMDLDNLFQKHEAALVHLHQYKGLSIANRWKSTQTRILDPIRRQTAHVKSLPFWQFRGVYWYFIRRTRMNNKSIAQQFPA
ncbi:MAG: sulfatase-like hydrolase/transferase [Candidatus Hydrogenedentes bacterium]|nr:sulfatase-like hydrolase/transferase [Candidatus Hydrogenedentota bacterium]